MERYEIIEIKNHLNNIGITGCDETSKGELAFSGASIPFDQIQVNSKFFYQDIPFKIFKTSQGDNIRLEAQKIKIKKSLLSVHFLGVSSRGDFQENIYFYNKNNKVKKDLSFTDFRTQKAFFDDYLLLKLRIFI